MVKFAHMGDCHLGGWRIPELQNLNLDSFRFAINSCISEKVDFVLIAGDLFDSAYPPIEIIKEAFNEFRKLKEARIPVFLIAGSHDYSVSGKSFLDVLEKAGFAKNVFIHEEKNDSIMLYPTIHNNVAIYGYPGKKSGLEVPEIEKIKLQDSPGLFKILMLHTTLRDAFPDLSIPAVDERNLPKVDYVALAHLHLKYAKENRVYCGPTFPNNLSELEDLRGGSFYIVDTSGGIKRHEIKLKEIIVLDLEISDSLTATDSIISEIENYNLSGKILILKLKGLLERGKISDIDFNKIENFVKSKKIFAFLKNTTRLQGMEADFIIDVKSDNLEEEIISRFQKENPNKFNHLIHSLLHPLQMDKKEDESLVVFEERILSETKKVLGI